ncbi:MAG: CehA/McbA family metallohydrolase [Acidobacteriota bacterium]|nr:CehA/McbA family metallohydrolase [Acidobacteriota bacterium]
MESRHRQLLLALLLLGLAAFCHRKEAPPGPNPAGAPAALQDLYAIFSDEIRPEAVGNVYQGVGNRFQLEGKLYAAVLKALNAYDILQETTRLPEADRERLLPKSHLEAREAFAALEESLGWPRIRVDVGAQAFELESLPQLDLHREIPQPLLLTLHNSTSETRMLSLLGSGLRLEGDTLEVAPSTTRHLLAQIDAPETGEGAACLSVTSEGRTATWRLPFRVAESGLLEGRLVESEGGAPTIGRIRVTDEEGRFRAPLEADYGLVLRPRRDPARWSYASGKFRLRAPAGKIRISIRRGMEYLPIDEELELEAGQTLRRTFGLKRWAHMEREGWHSGDTHIHMLDPPSALFEMQAENLRVGHVLVLEHMGKIYSAEHFRGELDPISDSRHLVYYNQEYRNQTLGHVSLLSLKKLVEPISTGGLAVPETTVYRYSYLRPSRKGFPRSGQDGWPDALVLDAMRETHRQGGLVNWAHLRPAQLEFPIDMVFGEIDTADILTHTRLPQTLKLWYALLNCGFRLPATAGTDRIGPEEPVGHQRVYVKLDGPLTYPGWMEGLRQGRSFVTNGPMVSLSVDGRGPGDTLTLSKPKILRIQARARSLRPFERLEIVVNGKVAASVPAQDQGRRAELSLEYPADQGLWIAARCMGGSPEETSIWTHPLFAHANPVYIDYPGRELAEAESGCYLLDFLKPLEKWAREEAYFENRHRKDEALATIRKGMDFYRRLCNGGSKN